MMTADDQRRLLSWDLNPIVLSFRAMITAFALTTIALSIYGLVAIVRGSTRLDERENTRIYEAKMHASSDAIDKQAEHDTRSI
jgi:hypothetical protein